MPPFFRRGDRPGTRGGAAPDRGVAVGGGLPPRIPLLLVAAPGEAAGSDVSATDGYPQSALWRTAPF